MIFEFQAHCQTHAPMSPHVAISLYNHDSQNKKTQLKSAPITGAITITPLQHKSCKRHVRSRYGTLITSGSSRSVQLLDKAARDSCDMHAACGSVARCRAVPGHGPASLPNNKGCRCLPRAEACARTRERVDDLFCFEYPLSAWGAATRFAASSRRAG